MAHPFWKGSLSFGLVEIGVTLQPSRAADELAFTLLDRGDFAPVGYKRYNKRTGREVPWDRIVRGYEYEPDQFVVLTDDELRNANPEASRTIELVAFVDRGEIDPIYFETPYFVLPQRRSSRGYTLLRDTLASSGLVGIVRVVLRTRQHVGALLVHDRLLMLNTLRYAEQIRPTNELETSEDESEERNGKHRRGGKAAAQSRVRAPASRGAAAPSAAEIKMATMLVEHMRGKWKPAEFHDDYRRDVMDLVRKKVKAGKTHEIVTEQAPRETPEPREVVDLMALLKRSLERRGPQQAAVPTSSSASRSASRRAPAKRRRA